LKRNAKNIVAFKSGEDLSGCVEGQELAGTIVDGVLDGAQVVVGEGGQGGALGQVLANQAVHVLVGAALPRTVRIAEEDVHAKPLGQILVQGHLGALVIGESLAQRRRDGSQTARKALEDGGGAGVVHAGKHEEATGALDDGAHGGGVAGALDEIGLPVARDDASGDLRRAQGDGSHVLQPGEASRAASAGKTAGMAVTQQLDQFGAQSAARHGIDSGVDGLMRDGARGVHEAESAGSLLGRPATAQQGQDELPVRRAAVDIELAAKLTGADPASLGHALRDDGKVARTTGDKTELALAADGCWVDTDLEGNAALGMSFGEHDLDGQAIREAKVRVMRMHKCDTLEEKTCCTSNWSRP